MRKFVEVLNRAAVVNFEAGPVRVIIGGNDGVLVTIDANGHIHVTPPGGPGDPEIRQAVASITEGVAVLSRLGIAEEGVRGATA